MKPHPVCRATYTLYMWHYSHSSVSSLSLYWQHHTHSVWHHTWIMFGIFCTIQDITSSLYDNKPLFLWHHSDCIWHGIHCICVITSTLLMISQYSIFEVSSAIYDDIISILYDITATECVSSHQHFQRHNTLCMEDKKPTICKISYTV